MCAASQTAPAESGATDPQLWQGRSGRIYRLAPESLDRFTLGEAHVFLILKGASVLWAGSSDELVDEPVSRSRFRRALSRADAIFRLEQAGEDSQRLSIIVDLEGGAPATRGKVQAA